MRGTPGLEFVGVRTRARARVLRRLLRRTERSRQRIAIVNHRLPAGGVLVRELFKVRALMLEAFDQRLRGLGIGRASFGKLRRRRQLPFHRIECRGQFGPGRAILGGAPVELLLQST